MLEHLKSQIVRISFNSGWRLLAVQLSQNITTFLSLIHFTLCHSLSYNPFQDMYLFWDLIRSTLPLSGFCERATVFSLFFPKHICPTGRVYWYPLNQWEISTKGIIATNLNWSLPQGWVVIDLITQSIFQFYLLPFEYEKEAVASLNPASLRVSIIFLLCFLPICRLVNSLSLYLSCSTLPHAAISNQDVLVIRISASSP